MNRVLLNTLYVSQSGTYVHLENEQVVIERDKKVLGRVPMHHIGALVLLDSSMISSGLMRQCNERGITISWFDYVGRFAGSLRGAVSGNVLLRLAQVNAYQDEARKMELARSMVRGKLTNARHTLLRRARELKGDPRERVTKARKRLHALLKDLGKADSMDALRGYEGTAARAYFRVFNAILAGEGFDFDGRNKRPPRDPINALLSYVYTITTTMCVEACEGVGLDPQIGFLHEVRPGRPSLALDLVEELRSAFADRLVFTLINRKQIDSEQHFAQRVGGAVYLDEAGRKVVLEAIQKRKQDLIKHTLFKERVPFGLIPHIQARLLARHLRGDLDAYPSFEYR